MKPRILFVLHLPLPVHGASMMGSYIKESNYLNDRFDADFINLSTSTSLSEIGKGGFKKNYQLIKILIKILGALFKKKYDFVYLTLTANGAGFYKDVLVVAMLKVFQKKIIYHFHNKGVSTAKDTAINKALYKFVFKDTKSILLSPALYDDVAKYVDIKNVYFCPNGIPVLSGLDPEKMNIHIPGKPVSILFLSNMMQAKGVYVLLDACEKLNNRGIKFQCDFVGAWSDITEDDFIKEVNKRNLASMVKSHGKKYGQDKDAFFYNANVFAFPTYYHYETFGLVLLEAMQFRLPVISTFEAGIPDVVANGETGFLVPQRNAEELAIKLEYLISNPYVGIKMGIAGESRYKTLFTKEIFLNNLAAILAKQ